MKNYKELLITAKAIRNLPPQMFSMEEFYKKSTCGTACCFLGWNPTFNPKTKLKLVIDDGFQNILLGSVEFDGLEGLEAAAEYFGITSYEAHELFGGHLESDPKQIATAVEKFVVSKLKKKKR